jgi:hypothetical protein
VIDEMDDVDRGLIEAKAWYFWEVLGKPTKKTSYS